MSARRRAPPAGVSERPRPIFVRANIPSRTRDPNLQPTLQKQALDRRKEVGKASSAASRVGRRAVVRRQPKSKIGRLIVKSPLGRVQNERGLATPVYRIFMAAARWFKERRQSISVFCPFADMLGYLG